MEYTEEFKDKCNTGDHDLIKIYSAKHSWEESYDVVKWCRICGAVVVDLEYHIVKPGSVMKMKYPLQVYPKK